MTDNAWTAGTADSAPPISIILATRDRPGPFAAALASVLAQDLPGFEVLVIEDGTAEEHRAAYDATLDAARTRIGGRLRHHRLPRRPRGHGQSYVLNLGVALAAGGYVGFLDDDDAWTDPGHLSRAARALAAAGGADLYMANQAAWRGEERMAGPVWIETLAQAAAGRGLQPSADGVFAVGVGELMALDGFCHVNALIVRRAHWEAVGGMDEGIRWECDRDLYLRLVDAAGTMLHHPAFVARHNIPDPAQGASMTTSLGTLDRLLYRLRVMDKACLFAGRPAIRAHARLHKAYTLKHITEELRAAGRWRDAAFYARQALGAGPTLKWAGFTLLAGVAALRPGRGMG